MARKGSDRAATGTENLSVLRRGALACPRPVCLAPLPRLPGRCGADPSGVAVACDEAPPQVPAPHGPLSSSRRVRRRWAERLDHVAVPVGPVAHLGAQLRPTPVREQANGAGAPPRSDPCTASASARGGRGNPIASRSRSSINEAIACRRVASARRGTTRGTCPATPGQPARSSRGSERAPARTPGCTARIPRRSRGFP